MSGAISPRTSESMLMHDLTTPVLDNAADTISILRPLPQRSLDRIVTEEYDLKP